MKESEIRTFRKSYKPRTGTHLPKPGDPPNNGVDPALPSLLPPGWLFSPGALCAALFIDPVLTQYSK
jgi:hypothetical protein